MMPRYYLRWRTAMGEGNLRVVGYSICDNRRSHSLEVADFDVDELDHASAICRLLNTQEGIDDESREG
jgi:hypothetical protein